MTSDSSHSEQDQKLSKSIEEANTQSISISEDADPIASDLLNYRKSKKEAFQNQVSNKQTVWEAIESKTKDKQASNILTFVSSRTRVWASAAVILIAALLSIVYFENFRTPTLIAQSGDSIENVTLTDGSSVTLRPNSKLYSLASSNEQMTYEIDGEAFFDVKSNPSRTFSVQAKNGTVSVLGTRFNVSSWGNTLQIFLEEGSVKVQSNSNDDSLILKPGESASIGENNLPAIHNLSAAETTDWLNNELVFDNKQVALIIAELEQQFNINIEIESSIKNQKLSGQLSLLNVEAALTDIGLVLEGTFSKTSVNNYTFQSN